MTKRTTMPSNISLTLLIDYVQALLPTLTSELESPVSKTSDHLQLLWVTQDQAALGLLQTLLNNTKDQIDSNSKTGNTQLATLSMLDQQPVLERYELACFWLPTLSVESMQHYVPLLMRYRDLYAAHLLVAVDSTIDLRAYGFTPFDITNDTKVASITDHTSLGTSKNSVTLWQFNLYDYKVLPNWLNSKYWANPENWNKGRW